MQISQCCSACCLPFRCCCCCCWLSSCCFPRCCCCCRLGGDDDDGPASPAAVAAAAAVLTLREDVLLLLLLLSLLCRVREAEAEGGWVACGWRLGRNGDGTSDGLACRVRALSTSLSGVSVKGKRCLISFSRPNFPFSSFFSFTPAFVVCAELSLLSFFFFFFSFFSSACVYRAEIGVGFLGVGATTTTCAGTGFRAGTWVGEE